MHVVVCILRGGGFSIHCHSADEEGVPVPSKPLMAHGQNNRRLARYKNGFLGTSGHRQMMNPSVLNLQHRLVHELSAGLSFDQRQAQWRIHLFWRQLQTLSARFCRPLARNLHSPGYTKTTCSQDGGPCESSEKCWRTTTASARGVLWKIYGFSSMIGKGR